MVTHKAIIIQNSYLAGNILLYKLIHMVDSGETGYKIGFDSCTVLALVNISSNINMDSLDTCEGAGWSAYISADMKMMPCNFDNQDMWWAVNLRDYTIEEAWRSNEFENFRVHFRTCCPNCAEGEYCMGGCPIRTQVALCDKIDKLQVV